MLNKYKFIYKIIHLIHNKVHYINVVLKSKPMTSNRDHSNANLAGVNLSTENLCLANLQGANLTNARLVQTILKGANLCKVNAKQANFYLADLTNADCSEAIFCKASFEEANLTNATLIGVDFSDARFISATLVNADLTNANLTNTHLCGADLTGANLNGVIGLGTREGEVKFACWLLDQLKSGIGQLEMKHWHTCQTIHCLAGWAFPDLDMPAAPASRLYPTLARFFYNTTNEKALEALELVASGKLSVFPD
jgi:hypothetical protein